MLYCLTSASSDHCPLLIDCAPRSETETLPLRAVLGNDGRLPRCGFPGLALRRPRPDPFRRIYERLKVTVHKLRRWGVRRMGDISLELLLACEIIACLDEAQDFRLLSDDEAWLRRKLKCAYLGLASLERFLIRQRTRFSWLPAGKTHSGFRQVHVAHRMQKNKILELRVDQPC